MVSIDLTPKQRKVFTFLRDRIAKGTCPTIREIADRFKIASLNGVVCHLEALKRKGYIGWEHGKKRTIRILRERPTCPHCGGEL